MVSIGLQGPRCFAGHRMRALACVKSVIQVLPCTCRSVAVEFQFYLVSTLLLARPGLAMCIDPAASSRPGAALAAPPMPNTQLHSSACCQPTTASCLPVQVSPLLMLAAFSPSRGAPRRFGLAALAGGSLVGVVANAVLMATQGPSAFRNTTACFPPPWAYASPLTRSPPYFAGMFASLALWLAHQRSAAAAGNQLPTVAARPSSTGTEGKGILTASSESVESGTVLLGAEGATTICLAADSSSERTGAGPAISDHASCMWGKPWGGRLHMPLDLLALFATCGLAYCGVGNNM